MALEKLKLNKMKKLLLMVFFVVIPLVAETEFLEFEYHLRAIYEVEDKGEYTTTDWLHGFNPPYVTVEGSGSRKEMKWIMETYKIRTHLHKKKEDSWEIGIEGLRTGLFIDTKPIPLGDNNYHFQITVLLDKKFHLLSDELISHNLYSPEGVEGFEGLGSLRMLEHIAHLLFLKDKDKPVKKYGAFNNAYYLEKHQRKFNRQQGFHLSKSYDIESGTPEQYYDQEDVYLYRHLYHPRVMISHFREKGSTNNLRSKFTANFWLEIDYDHFLQEMKSRNLLITVPDLHDPSLTPSDFKKYTYREGVLPVQDEDWLRNYKEKLNFVENEETEEEE